MGKRERHLKIKEIITNYAIKTQEELVEHLRERAALPGAGRFRGILKICN